MIYVVIVLLCTTVLLLSIKLNLLIKGLREVTVTLDDILLENKSRICYVSNNSKAICALAQRINSLIQEYQGIVEKIKRNEIMTKQFISDLSHDIRTPLTSILGYIDELSSKPSLVERDRNRYIEIVACKGERLHKFIDDMFEYAKLEADNTDVRLTKQNLSELVKKMLCFMYQDLIKVELSAVIDIPEKDLYVWGDETSINRILQNLLSNVLRYGKPGSYFGITLREEPERVWVDVWNQGEGISQDEIKDVFSRLYIARNHCEGSSGLGLPIAKRLVQNMNGEIGVSIVPNEKTTLSFFLKKSI
jgi:signal transduction histidine kinase